MVRGISLPDAGHGKAQAKTALHGKVNVCESTAVDKPVMHHCHIVETGNESYRFQHSSMAAKSRIKSREQRRKGGKAVEEDEPF